jgi:hypothetical protein
MHSAVEIEKKLEKVFNKRQAVILAEVIDDAYSGLVMTGDFNELKEIVRDLGIKVGELAEAQKRTAVEIRELIIEHKETRKQLGGLTATVGYSLEDEADKGLPGLLKRDFGIMVKGRLKRGYVKDNKGGKIEVNIIGEAIQNGKKVMVIGEGKSQLSKNNVDEFIRRKLKRLGGVFEQIFPVLITYMISEDDVGEYAKEKEIALYYSYDF